MARIGHPYGGEFTGSQKPSQALGIAPVGLDPVAGLLRYQRRRHDEALVTKALDQSLQAVAGRAGLVAERELRVLARQLRHQLARGGLTRVDLAEIAHLACPALLGDGHRIAQLRCIDADRVMASISTFLETRMRLQVNVDKSAVRHPSTVHFLGFRFLLRQDGQIGVLLSAKTGRRLAATIREKTPPNWGRSISSCMDGLSRYLNGWMAHYRLCTPDAVQAMGVFDAHIRRRIRAIIVRQKKRQRFLFRHLLAKGASRKAAAGAAYCGRGAWHRSNRPGLTRAYPPSWFAGRLVSLKTRWSELNPPQASDQLSLAF